MKSNRQLLSAAIYDRKGRVLSVGQNSYVKTHPLQAKMAKAVGEHDKIFLHAEIESLVRLKDWARAHRIVVTRYNRLGNPATAKPCRICQYAIKLAGIKHISHT